MKKVLLVITSIVAITGLLSAQQIGKTLLIADFTSGSETNKLGGKYALFDDNEDPIEKGNSIIDLDLSAASGFGDTGKCMHLTWKLKSRREIPYAGLTIHLKEDFSAYPAAAEYDGISFIARGKGSVWVRFPITDTAGVYNEYQFGPIKLDKHWTEFKIAFDKLKQQDWGDRKTWNPKHLYGITFGGDQYTSYKLDMYMDNLKFIKFGTPPASGTTEAGNEGMLAQKNLVEVFGKSVAVVGLQSSVVSDPTSSSLLDFLINALVNVNRVDVIDRQSIDLIMKEQKLQLSGITDASTATEIGKIIGVEYVLIANLSKIENIYYLHVKMIDVETATIIGSTMTPANGPSDFLNMCNKGIDALFQKL